MKGGDSINGIVVGFGITESLRQMPFRSVYFGPKGQFIAVKARTREGRERQERLLFQRHNARPLFRVNVKERTR